MENTPNKIGYTGICANCIHQDTCTFPKNEEVKIHCEEYECM
jgi:hypothetical protein